MEQWNRWKKKNELVVNCVMCVHVCLRERERARENLYMCKQGTLTPLYL